LAYATVLLLLAGNCSAITGTNISPSAADRAKWDASTRTATVVVAAYDASDDWKNAADVICDGIADQDTITGVVDCNTRVILSDGTFLINNISVNNYGIFMDCNNCILDMSPGTWIIVDANGESYQHCDPVRQGVGIGGQANYNVTIRGGNIDCNYYGDATTVNKAVMMNGYATDPNLSYNLVIDGVHMMRAKDEGCAIEYSHNGEIKNCYVKDCGWSGITMADMASGSVHNNWVDNCGLIGGNPPLSKNISLLGCSNMDVYQNYITNAKQGGIGINAAAAYIHPSQNISIRDNTITNFKGASGIRSTATDSKYTQGLDISGNDINTMESQSGILLEYIKTFNITNNTIRNCLYWLYLGATCYSGNVEGNRYTSGKLYVTGSTSTKINSLNVFHITDIKELDTDFVYTLNAGETIQTAHSDINQLDIPRIVSVAAVTHTNFTVMQVQVYGYDQFGSLKSNLVDLHAGNGWASQTAAAFSVISFVQIYARTGTGSGDSVVVGINNKVAIPEMLISSASILKAKRNGANIAVPTIDTTYSLLTLAAISDDDDFTFWIKRERNWAIYP